MHELNPFFLVFIVSQTQENLLCFHLIDLFPSVRPENSVPNNSAKGRVSFIFGLNSMEASNSKNNDVSERIKFSAGTRNAFSRATV